MRTEVIWLNDRYPFLGADAHLDAYFPYNLKEMHREKDKRPCMIVCPGGGYCFISERENQPMVMPFLAAGYNVFALTYSVNRPFPLQLLEVAACMELIHEQADVWNCDTSRIAILGFSAGGHLAAHYSTMFDHPAVRQVFPASKGVNATVLAYPVITADPRYTHSISINTLLGHEVTAEEDVSDLSCEKQVKDSTPPAFIWHTAEDDLVPVKNSLLYAEALMAHNIPVELHIYPFGNHGLATCDKQTLDNLTPAIRHAGSWLPLAMEWLDLILQ